MRVVHRAVGEQNQDGGSHVAAPTASASASTTARAAETETAARVEAQAASARSESAEAGLPERAVPVGAVLTHVLAEIATGLPPLFVQDAALLWTEAEAEPAG